MTSSIETPVFAWRGWSNPIFGLQGSAVMSCFRTALDFEVINGSCCEHEAVKCASKGFTSYTHGFIILLPKF
jgi:hypothetical protein